MKENPDDVTAYDYELPSELIASEPVPERDGARLLVVHRNSADVSHRMIRDLPSLLNPGDCLVLNDTRVIPARLRGVREATGGKWEGLFLRTVEGRNWELLGQTRGRIGDGEVVVIPSRSGLDEPLRLTLVGRGSGGSWVVCPHLEDEAFLLLDRYGDVPLPPYIRKGVAAVGDSERYQTVYASSRGSVAAPTAGLHLTHELLEQCARRGIERTFVTLHVGIGTFRPMSSDRLSEHEMHSEWGELTADSAELIQRVRASGGRIVAVGTTSVRVLESAAASGTIRPFRGETNLFIRPPYQFRCVDALLTNFHLPRSTLLVLVSTMAGRQLIREAYASAIRERYRFFSYGDAMLIV